jgi:hypothetical protein
MLILLIISIITIVTANDGLQFFFLFLFSLSTSAAHVPNILLKNDSFIQIQSNTEPASRQT